MGIRGWRKLCEERAEWKKITEKAKTHSALLRKQKKKKKKKIYYTSLHASIITVFIIRRSNYINTSSGMISLCE
jgi:hypothetical protein